MQQRRLRLGDILDDYCPRERRITNHVVVAMIEDDVRQTRCSTCDAEHEYKQAKAPTLRRKKAGALSQDVLEEARPRAVAAAQPQNGAPLDSPVDDVDSDGGAADVGTEADPVPVAASATTDVADADSTEADSTEDERREDDGPVHRRLIRATLPRPEGQLPEWKEPDFTMRQPARGDTNGNRPGRARGHRPMRQAQGQQGGQNRFGGQRHGTGSPRHGSGAPHGSGQGQGHRQGNRPGPPGSQRSGGRPPGGGGQNRGPGRKRGR